MFPFINKTWNPLAGECSHQCTYCWARRFAERHKFSKYQGQPRIDERQIGRRFKSGDFVFVQDMSDLFAEDVPREVILRVFEAIKESPDAKFLLLTKRPRRYLEFLDVMPENAVLGCTVETDWTDGPYLYSRAPHPSYRLEYMAKVAESCTNDVFYSIEPIMEFSNGFASHFRVNRAWAVAVGYDNYGNGLPEPPLEKTLKLIEQLESCGIKVYRKTLREAAGQ